jgi:hypothetical protein
MGLPLPGHNREVDMESFSHNILKFELSGPEYEHFSVVDLPGLFRSTPFCKAGGDFRFTETYQSPQQAKQRGWTWIWSGRWLESI